MLQKILLLLKQVFFLSPDESGSLWPSFLISGIFSFCMGFLLIGIPGALIMTGAKVVLTRVGIPVARESEATWGVVILVSLLMPLSIPAAHLLTRWGFPRTISALMGLTCVWWIFLGVLSAITPAK